MATSGLIIAQHQLPVGNCSFRFFTPWQSYFFTVVSGQKQPFPALLLPAFRALETPSSPSQQSACHHVKPPEVMFFVT